MLNKGKIFILMLATILVSPVLVQETQAWWFWDMVGVSWFWVLWTEKKQNDSLVYTIRNGINWVIGVLSFISLVLCLYAWFLMLTSWWDSKKYNTGFSIIKYVAIGLAIIAVSWLIVSLIFYLINGATRPNIQ